MKVLLGTEMFSCNFLLILNSLFSRRSAKRFHDVTLGRIWKASILIRHLRFLDFQISPNGRNQEGEDQELKKTTKLTIPNCCQINFRKSHKVWRHLLQYEKKGDKSLKSMRALYPPPPPLPTASHSSSNVVTKGPKLWIENQCDF